VQTLGSVVQYGTGTAAAIAGRDVAGKTGTTEDNTNAWFNGITPQLATSVWVGDPKANTPMYDVGGITVFGGTYPARIWHDYTAAALSGQPAIAFAAPDPAEVPPPAYIPGGDSPYPSAVAPPTSTSVPPPAVPPTSPPPTSVPPISMPATG